MSTSLKRDIAELFMSNALFKIAVPEIFNIENENEFGFVNCSKIHFQE